MTIASYCKDKGMNKEEYKTFATNIENTASAIIENLKTLYPQTTGMYFPTMGAITSTGAFQDMESFVIQSLKAKGIEFIDNSTLWRF